MRRFDHHGIVFYRFEGLAGISSLEHAPFTRTGGVSQAPFAALNLGHTVGDDLQAVTKNHKRALGALGLGQEDVASCHQVHGAGVGVVGLADRCRVRSKTDALVTASPGVSLMLRFADCVPLVFFDRRRQVVGLAHAGWRGLAVGVVPATINMLVENLGCQPSDLWVGIGPSIGPCCYEVGPEVAASIEQATGGDQVVERVNGHLHLDLWAAAHTQLENSGVGQIEIAGLCTACHTSEWYSHRAEGGKTGRFGVVIGLKPGS